MKIKPFRYWVVSEAKLRELMERAAAGEDPDMLLMELWANSEAVEA